MVLDSGDTAWMLVAGSLVLLMIPALGLFESGLLRKKNAASIFMQIFFGLAMLSVMWFIFGFSISCLLYTSPSPRDGLLSRMPSSA